MSVPVLGNFKRFRFNRPLQVLKQHSYSGYFDNIRNPAHVWSTINTLCLAVYETPLPPCPTRRTRRCCFQVAATSAGALTHVMLCWLVSKPVDKTKAWTSCFEHFWPNAVMACRISRFPILQRPLSTEITIHTDASGPRGRSTICVVGAPFLSVAEGRKVYWEITILEAHGTIRVGFAGSKMTFEKLKPCEHIGQGHKSWALSSDNGNGIHRCESLLRCSSLQYPWWRPKWISGPKLPPWMV